MSDPAHNEKQYSLDPIQIPPRAGFNLDRSRSSSQNAWKSICVGRLFSKNFLNREKEKKEVPLDYYLKKKRNYKKKEEN